MRNLMIIGLILFRINITHGQDFAPIGAKWFFTEGYAGSLDIGFIELSVEKDTVIKEIKCKKIIKNKLLDCSTRPLVEYMYENDLKEVYFYDSGIDGFQKLWDFNPDDNESWSIKLGETDTLITYLVDSVVQIQINGQNLKKVYVTYKFHQNGYEYFRINSSIIENIGDLNYFFPWNSGVCDMNYADGLRCYSDSKLGDYSTEIAELCDYTYVWTNIQDHNQLSGIEVYPNPTKGYLELKYVSDSYNDFSFSIGDITGRIILSSHMNSDLKIDLSGLETGLYQVILYQGKHIKGITKVLKN